MRGLGRHGEEGKIRLTAQLFSCSASLAVAAFLRAA